MRKPTPTAPELAGQIVAQEQALAALKETRANTRRQLDWLTSEKERCEYLLSIYPDYESRRAANPGACLSEKEFWTMNAPEKVEARLKRVHEGGAVMVAHVSNMYFDNGKPQYYGQEVEVTLPSLATVTEQLADAEAQIAAADVALRELKGSSRATFEAAVTTAQKALSAARVENDRTEAALARCLDVDEAVSLRGRLDEWPLRLNLLERAVVEANIALLEADCPATDAEIRAASAVIAGLEEELKDLTARLLKARLALERLRGNSKDTATQANKLRDRLAELEFVWTQKLTSREVRTATAPQLSARF